MTDDPARPITGYGEPEDLADALGARYGPEVRARWLAHFNAKRAIEELRGAELTADLMAQRDELEELRPVLDDEG